MFLHEYVHETELESNFKVGTLLIHNAKLGLKTCDDEEDDIKNPEATGSTNKRTLVVSCGEHSE